MTSISNKSVTALISLMMFLGIVYMASASEVTGTLSSDGSTGAQREAVLGETTSDDSSATGQVTAQNSGQLQGTVVGGRSDNAAAAAASAFPWSTAMWLAVLTGGIATLVYFLWQRRFI